MLNTENRNIDLLISWGLSLVGRAPALHAGGQEFDSPSLHQILVLLQLLNLNLNNYRL